MADPVTAAIAVGWGLQAVGWIVSPIMSEIFKKGSSFLGFDTSKKLKELEPKVLLLQRVMEAVEESPDRSRLEQLFKNLKSAFYEAEDILDDVEYHRLKKQIQDGKLKSDGDVPIRMRDLMKKKLSFGIPSSSSNDQESGMSKSQLKNSFDKIEKVINDACEILERLNLPPVTDYNWRQLVPPNSRSAVTTAAPPLKVIGRDEDRDKIIAMLHDKECDGHESTNIGLCYSVIGIHGIAGSGKSTLAQYICDREKKDKEEEKVGHFDLVIWIHVSQKFDLQAILTEVLEGATGRPSSEFKNRNTLRENLVKELRGKRILLVLDDVWYNIRDTGHHGELEQVLSLLEVAKTGTKILVTSRSKDALVALGAVGERCIPISDLNYDVFLQMFMHYALRGAVVPGHDGIKLQMLGDEIAKKLNRSPLAARTVGAQLCLRPNVEFWRRTRDRDLLNETMGALWWSYQHLDEQVRRCFAYCSIYPRRRRLKRNELVQLWMAEGFIKTTNAEEEPDDVGQDYFDELLSASFLQLAERKMEQGCEVDYFTVHDLLRDLAEEAAIGDCFRIEKGFRGEVPPDVRHIFVRSCDRKMLTEKIFQLQNLRTLIMDYPLQIEISDEKFLESMFTRLQNLRVLVLRFKGTLGGRIFSLPASIGLLKHLRYFYFDMDVLMDLILPYSITKLYHIQLLDVSAAKGMDFSGAKHMSHLINLRRVSSGLDFPNIGRLKWLQILRGFIVKNKVGYEIRQLKQLNKLKGALAIMGLENVRGKEEAIEASVAQKEGVTELSFGWSDGSCSPEVEAEVLEGLCPSKYLERLRINNYQGSTYPNWMVSKQNGGPEHLRNLLLENCSRLEPAPELFEVFVHLRWFRLWHSNWDALPENMEQLTLLQVLDINGCPNIRLLPALPQSLEKFCLRACNEEFTRSCETTGDPNWQKIQHIPMKIIRRV
ncbi:putative disease resistance protein RGA3 [Lolium rigidum]|uniref:putative disease resistance protein RGA3 n=1 Tax=Lolium rigidum TaxID=89674 RepID=UPI001F5DD2BC|nr:putative disease resistance protein RGA3 [Lolium rigidum]